VLDAETDGSTSDLSTDVVTTIYTASNLAPGSASISPASSCIGSRPPCR